LTSKPGSGQPCKCPECADHQGSRALKFYFKRQLDRYWYSPARQDHLQMRNTPSMPDPHADPRRARNRILISVYPKDGSAPAVCRTAVEDLERRGFPMTHGALVAMQEHLRDEHLYHGSYNDFSVRAMASRSATAGT
jgi:hypothetical protein